MSKEHPTYGELADAAEAHARKLSAQVEEILQRLQWLKETKSMITVEDDDLRLAVDNAEAELDDARRELDAAKITAQAARAVVPE